jgi:putative proteasome-type protease
VFIILTRGSLSLSQSILTLLRRDWDMGRGLATAPSMYDAARVVGNQIRNVAELDRAYLERDKYNFNTNILLGGQIKGEPPGLVMVYPQGNPLQVSQDSPYLQIGETKYGRPILDRGIRFDRTSLEEAAKYALLSLDSTMKSNVTVGPPVDLLVYSTDELDITRHRRFLMDDADLNKIRIRWEQALRKAVAGLPNLRFKRRQGAGTQPQEDTIQLVEGGESEPQAVSQLSQPQPAQRMPV